MKQAVHVVEDVFAGDGFAGVGGLEVRKAFGRDRVAPLPHRLLPLAAEELWLLSLGE